MDDEMADMAIVGDGSTSIFLARGYTDEIMTRGWPGRNRNIVIIGPHDRVGPGTAWNESHPLMSSNMHRDTLRIFGGLNAAGNRFEIGKAVELFPNEPARDGLQPYVERGAVGDFLNRLFDETRAVAGGHHISMRHIRTEVVQIVREPGGFRLAFSNGGAIRARCVVVAVGLLSIDRYPHLSGHPGYHADSWKSVEILASLSDAQRIAIVGLGPTGIDWLLRLLNRDFRYPILMASRSGLLPAARPMTGARPPEGLFSARRIRRLAAKRALTRREVDLIVHAILERFGVTPEQLATHQMLLRGQSQDLIEQSLGNSWEVQPLFEALKEVDDVASVIWRCADRDAQAHIMRKWAGLYARLSFAVPPSNAKAVLDQIGTRRLRIRRGLEGVTRRGEGLRLHFAAEDDGEPRMEMVDALINASGFDGRLANVNNPLVRSMLASGLLCEAPHGGAMMDYETGQIVDCDGRRIAGLYAAGGSLTRSAGFVVNSIARTSEHGLSVGMACARYLQVLSTTGEQTAARLWLPDFVI